MALSGLKKIIKQIKSKKKPFSGYQREKGFYKELSM
jgi:hypothetical protein